MTYSAWQDTILDAQAVDSAFCYTKLLYYGGLWSDRNGDGLWHGQSPASYSNQHPCYAQTTQSNCTALTYKQTKYTNTSTDCPGSTYTTKTLSCTWDATVDQCINVTNVTACNNTPTAPRG
jgi:hypothetical protein